MVVGVSEKRHHEKIRSKALEILEKNPEGVRYSDLVKQISEALPEIPINTIHGCVWNLDKKFPSKVYKPERGLFILKKYETEEVKEKTKKLTVKKEEDFYQPFADWLEKETEEATKAIPLGGNKFKDKWGTPDVVGIKKPNASDIVKPPIEVISAEIKTDTSNLITAFGQACAYKLFSNKVYLLIPKQSLEEDIKRLDSLCLIFGIGLVTFDVENPKNPEFEIKVRPIKHEPDTFYTNKNLKLIEKELSP